MTRKQLSRRTAAWAAAIGSALTLGAPVATAMTTSESGGAPASSGQAMHDGSLNSVSSVAPQSAIQDGWLNSAIASHQSQPAQTSSIQDGWLRSSLEYGKTQQPVATSSSSSSRDLDRYFVPVGGAVLAALALASLTLVVSRRGQKPTLAGA